MNEETYDLRKFKKFDELLQRNGEADHILIHHPQVLGDNYVEIVTNLNKMVEAGFTLKIIPPSERGTLHTQRSGKSN